MRPLEIMIPVLLVVYLLWQQPRPLAIRLLPALVILLTVVHFAVEGYRWQMIPLYALTLLLGMDALRKLRLPVDGKSPGTSRAVLFARVGMVSLLAISTALPFLLPVPSIPVP